MSRYFTAPRAWFQFEPDVWAKPEISAVTVDEAIGAPIMRGPNQVGFLAKFE